MNHRPAEFASPESDEPNRLEPVVVRLSAGASTELEAIEIECNSPPWTKKLFEGEFSNACSRTYGARVAGIVVGFLVVHVVLDEAHIVSFGVRRLLRSRGVGRTIVAHVLRVLHEEAVRSVVLEVRRSNCVAQELYRSLGFIESGERSAYYADNREDAILMNLSMSEFVARWGMEDLPERQRSAA